MFKIQTHKRFKRTLFVKTKPANFRLIPFVKQQNNSETMEMSKKLNNLSFFFGLSYVVFLAQCLEELFIFKFCFPGCSFSIDSLSV